MSVLSTVPGTVARYHAVSSTPGADNRAPSAAPAAIALSAARRHAPTSQTPSGFALSGTLGGNGAATGVLAAALPCGKVQGSCGTCKPIHALCWGGQPTPTWVSTTRSKFGLAAASAEISSGASARCDNWNNASDPPK